MTSIHSTCVLLPRQKKKQEFVVIANNSIDKTATFTYLLSLMDKLESIVASSQVKALPQQSKT